MLPFANIMKASTAIAAIFTKKSIEPMIEYFVRSFTLGSMHNLVDLVILGGILSREDKIARERERQYFERTTGFHQGTAFFDDMDWRESEKSSRKKIRKNRRDSGARSWQRWTPEGLRMTD